MSQNPEPKPESGPSVSSSEVLAAVRQILLARAATCEQFSKHAVERGWWHEAHEAEVRRGVWESAASVVEVEIAANTVLSHTTKENDLPK